MIFKIPDTYDLVISYTWARIDHGKVSGHIFEVIDYYLFLKQYYNVCIFIGDNKSYEDIINLVRDKYNIDSIKDILFYFNPKILDASQQTVIITDGAASYIFERGGTIFYKNLIVFRCGLAPSFKSLENKKNVYLLQDNRIYSKNPEIPIVNYKKKILFNALKPKTKQGSFTFLYLTKNCRSYSIEKIKSSYNFKKYLICKGTPIPDLINKISSYIYTPVQCKGTISYNFDCSPRLIAECTYYNIPIYYYNIDYKDKGLEARKYDIEHDFKSLYLKKDDYLLTILKDII